MRSSLLLVVFLLVAVAARPVRSATYHVAPSGSDAAIGSEAAPWRTIQHAANQVMDGDTVLVHAGTYRESVVLSTSGAPDSPIVFSAETGALLESPDPEASLSAFDVQPDVGHLVVRGFEARGGFHETILVRSGAHDVEIADCDVHGNRAGIWISGAADIEVSGCRIHHNAVHGLRVTGDSRDVTVRDTISEANDDGLGCAGDADGFAVEETSTNVRFVDCQAIGNGEDGFDLQGDGMWLAGVESRDNACAGVKLYQNARLENSLVAGNQTGISTTSIFNPSVRIDIRNSTIADNSGTQLLLRGPGGGVAEEPLYSVSVRNVVASGPGKALEVLSSVDLEEDHNIFFRADSTSRLVIRHFADGSERRYSGQEINEGVWKAESGQGQGSFAIEPRFEEGDSYCIAAEAAAVDSGAEEDAPAVDRYGNPRPAGLAVDIGPDELPVAMSNHRPWADPGPDRMVVAGATLHLRAYGSTDPDGDALTFEWDFGDESEEQSGYDVWHTYVEPGEYTATLTVSDGSLSHARSALIHVVPPPTATATPMPTAMPTPSTHDSQIRPFLRGKRIHLRARDMVLWRRIRVVVRNADVREDPGHEIHVSMEAAGCPAGVTVGAPDFSRSLPGAQDRLLVRGGRRKRAIALLTVDSATLRASMPEGQQRCVLRFTAAGPGIDPTPENNVAELSIDLIDPMRR